MAVPPFVRGVRAFNEGRIALARRTLAQAVRAGDDRAPWACQQLIQTFVQRGQTLLAGPALDDACHGQVALGELARGYLLGRLGRSTEAETSLERAAARSSVAWPARLELTRLWILSGRREEARGALAACVRHYKRAGDDWGLSATLAQQATVALEALDSRRAKSLALRCQELRERLDDRLGLGFALQLQAKASYLESDYVPAMESLRAALDVHLRAGHLLEAAVSYNNIGLWHLDLANPHHARAAFISARRLLRRIGAAWREGITLSNLGNASLQLGHTAAGEHHYRDALVLLRSDARPDPHGIALAELAESCTRRGRASEAQRLLADAPHGVDARTRLLLDGERVRAMIAAGDIRRAVGDASGLVDEVRRLPGSMFSRLLPRIRATTIHARALLAAGRLREAAAAARQVGRSVDALLENQASATVRMGVVETCREAQDLLCQALLAGGVLSVRTAWAATAASKARELRLRRGGPAHTGRASPGAGLGLQAALVEYHVAGDATYVFIGHRQRERVLTLPIGESGLRHMIDQLLRPLRSTAGLPHLEELDLTLAERLFRLLVQPVVASLPSQARRLVIVADGPLHALPFEMLVMGRQRSVPSTHPPLARFHEPRYLAEAYDVSYRLSSQSPGVTDRSPADRGMLLCLARSPSAGELLQTVDGPIRLRPLAGVVREGHEVTRHCADERRLFVGSKATPAAYHEHAPRSALIHLAAHAIADDRGPDLSGVALAGGFLSAREIRETPLKADLVVLSACETARGQLRAREGALGLGRAFLEAGAHAVIASLWTVDDEATRTLMNGFYRRLWSSSPAPALAAARRELRNQRGRHLFPTTAHPFFWSSFVLIEP